ncbi:hypothetical protein C1637_05050 [Chryseobacterium lactis]|uniref:DUF4348 domain-containing protein n=1 Tax=Chryseobacterium lactis TaxID=1241981 RepID=A0A3G6RHT6_CHRLC|nr:hypothetical protein [Chryseobacterium lactis]AZA84214.1 hypothetical protein EG342_21020 [Chryseobacterium lactis]AZB04602.1 hypothetical protein EG341_11900 [Chryseobacterium lactis]PNW14333.1 hypothetical protein C1637_05050 [Chryseobacterium lactis]
MKNIISIILLSFCLFSCNSLDKDEYEILNLTINRCVFVQTDIEELSKIADEQKISLDDALKFSDAKNKDRQYTYTISDTLYSPDLPTDIRESLRRYDIFDEGKNRSNQSVLIDFNKIKPIKAKKRINSPVKDSNYLGNFKFHRVLFDRSGNRAYIQVESPKNYLFNTFGLMLEKKNGEWKFKN